MFPASRYGGCPARRSLSSTSTILGAGCAAGFRLYRFLLHGVWNTDDAGRPGGWGPAPPPATGNFRGITVGNGPSGIPKKVCCWLRGENDDGADDSDHGDSSGVKGDPTCSANLTGITVLLTTCRPSTPVVT